MTAPKNPATSAAIPMHSAAPPPSTLPYTHSTPPVPSSKSAVDPQPMDLDHTKSKNPPWICYNCNKPGHIACNCPEPHVHRVCNTDPLSLETTQAITEAIRIAVGGDATRGEEVTGDIYPIRVEAKESQDF